MFRTLLKAIQQMQDGKEAPGLVRDKNYLSDFVCFEGPIAETEDGPSQCRKLLAAKTAAE